MEQVAPGPAPVNQLPLAGGSVRFARVGPGHGRDLVMLHGLLGSGQQWRAAAACMGPRFTTWMLELPAISASSNTSGPRPLSLPGLAAWLGQATAALGLRRFSLLGSSWGGAVALQFALTAPSALEGLVLVAPAHPYWTPSRRQRWLLTPLGAR
ncbi:MAG: alpha/beta fold hydrolase, partial [Terriglobales bacterium]